MRCGGAAARPALPAQPTGGVLHLFWVWPHVNFLVVLDVQGTFVVLGAASGFVAVAAGWLLLGVGALRG